MKEKKEKTESVMADSKPTHLAFGKGNFTIMLAGVALIIIGFIIMSLDKEEFGFGFMGLTLGPIVAFSGFMIEFYALLKKKS
ncbi:DUF3098 domain-containing protein [Lacihabitans lacunae]|jgi:hypothetical protein|uniref:DUF3098 domain-containing protein n=1 Tax=Lacihabitans lacunae TaxID=1028214 RepID=A0ABV7YRI2_9BACT